MSKKTKFKVGDNVKILPSAKDISVSLDEIGNVGVITIVYDDGDYELKTASKRYGGWWVRECDIAPAIVVGQQLLLWEWV